MPNPQKQQINVKATFDRDYKIMVTYTITDRVTIAALTAAGIKCLSLTLHAGDAFAVYKNTAELRMALQRLGRGKLELDPIEYTQSLDELNWRLAEEAYDQAQQK